MASINPIFEEITKRWFVIEPALFATYCTHHLEENSKMKCVIRTGHGIIEYNPNMLPESKVKVEELLRSEIMRIMLKHPNDRQPSGVKRIAIGYASDMVLADNCKFKYLEFMKPDFLGLEHKKYFEWYAHEIDRRIIEVNGQDGDIKVDDETIGSAEVELDRTANWEEEDYYIENINEVLRQVKDWGTLEGKFSYLIKANLEAKIDYRRALAGFRASVQSSNRTLTRMRPNRRFEFEAMGSKYKPSSNILIAVDTSGSVSDKALQNFFGIILKFFKYNVSLMDVIQFDAAICGNLLHLDKQFKVTKDIKISGRGGTNFQKPIDYLKDHQQYDGMIIFTDGDAPEPVIDFHNSTKILWVCQDEVCYKKAHSWMEKTGRVCYIQ